MTQIATALRQLPRLAALFLLALSACTSPPDTSERSPLLAAALTLNRRAGTAFADQEYDRAIQLYFDALKIHQSLENPPGILRNLLNIAVVNKAAGKDSAAIDSLAAIDRYLDTLRRSNPTEAATREVRTLQTEALLMQAQSALKRGAAEEARTLLQQARQSAPGNDRLLAGRSLTVEALLLERAEQPTAAMATARQALRLLTKAPADERADPLRILGRAALAAGQPEEAHSAFSQALAIDQESGHPAHVTDALLGMARASRALGENDRALATAERALASARSADDAPRTAQARAFLASAP